jgi:hypothetical protein
VVKLTPIPGLAVEEKEEDERPLAVRIGGRRFGKSTVTVRLIDGAGVVIPGLEEETVLRPASGGEICLDDLTFAPMPGKLVSEVAVYTAGGDLMARFPLAAPVAALPGDALTLTSISLT